MQVKTDHLMHLISFAENTPKVVEMICQDQSIKKLSFTGSTTVGKLLLQKSADTVKRVSLELGGNAPFIVFDSADMNHVINSAVYAKFRANGQACIAANRFLVQKGIHKRFIEELTRALVSLKVGTPFDENTEVSCLINEGAVCKIDHHIMDAVRKGGTPVLGCERHPLGENYYKPTILDNCNESMHVMSRENFGPVAAVMKFDTEEEAIAIANNSASGLAGYIFSQDISQVFRMVKSIDAGMIGVNESSLPSELVPMGGMKESGLGREGSKYGINDYLEFKYVLLGGL